MSTPGELVKTTLDKWSSKSGKSMKNPDDYILQVIGMEDYLYGNFPLVRFKVNQFDYYTLSPQIVMGI